MYHFPCNLTEDCNLLGQISSLNADTLNRTIEHLQNHTSPIEELKTITIPIKETHKHIIESHVNCLYFEELMEKHGIKKFDFLNIDAEGLDYEIIMSIEIQKYLPSVICIETAHFCDNEIEEFTAYMAKNNYRRIQKFTFYSDIFAINRKT
ncbi:MAG: FkbM family methyltransferase [Pseudomonadales bacterium]